MTLARDVPASVLTDLLGISIEAATRWGKLASRDWVEAPRLRNHSHSGSEMRAHSMSAD